MFPGVIDLLAAAIRGRADLVVTYNTKDFPAETAASWTETVIYSFNSGPEGQNPVGLVQGSDENFYWTSIGAALP